MRPNYYKATIVVDGKPTEVECFDVIEGLGLGFNLGNAMKYLWRAGRKSRPGDEDLRKAVTYLQREIEAIQNSDST